jgi:hypothetical protein
VGSSPAGRANNSAKIGLPKEAIIYFVRAL